MSLTVEPPAANGDSSVAAGVQRDDLAVGVGHRKRRGEVAAGQRARAGVGVIPASRRDEAPLGGAQIRGSEDGKNN
jgi:hypothetical protein